MLRKEVRSGRRRPLSCVTAAIVCWCVVTVAMADEVRSAVKKATNIAAQELAPALQALARDRKFQIVYVSEEISGRSTQGAAGELTVEEALARLLEGTGFTFKDLDDKTVTIVAATRGDPRTAASPAPTTQATQPQTEVEPASLAEVTVEARRQALEHRLSHFVASITQESGSDESLARWHRRICPFVAGLTQDRDDLVLERITTITRLAGAPLAPGKCDPNLLVLFTTDPTKLVKDMVSRNAGRFMALAGRRADGAALRKFAETALPVRAWYNSQLTGALGNLHAFDEADMGGSRPLENDHATLSRIQHDDVQELTSVLVIVDARRIEGLKLGAVADYATLLGLAKINLNADVAGEDSVLRLFTASTDAAATMSQLGAWDVAFLKALYGTEQASRMQRQSIVNSMLRDATVVASQP